MKNKPTLFTQSGKIPETLLPIGKYRKEPIEDIRKGFAVTVALASISYGLSAQIMGKPFAKYAIYGAISALTVETMTVLYSRWKDKEGTQ